MLQHYFKWNNPDMNQKLEILRDKMDSLIARETDVRLKIEIAETWPGKIRRMEVVHWLLTVEEKKTQLLSIEMEVLQWGRNSLIYRIGQLIEDVQGLLQLGSFPNGLVLDGHKSRSSPFPLTGLVNEMSQKIFETICRWLESPLPLLIGLHGMGGVGKTTLLKHIHNYLQANSDVAGTVFWVTVSQDCSVYKLQQKIAYAVTCKEDLDEEDEERRAQMLHNILGKMQKTVLILDDLWGSFRLDEVGIIPAECSCKIVMGSRSPEVCRRMGCGEFAVQVKTLSQNEAWRLFVHCLPDYMALATEVKQIAALVAEECRGLPLAVVTIAASMRGVLSRCDWKNALDELRNVYKGQHDMEHDVLRKLKFSYDRLNDKTLQYCFLSCVLYGEDHKIPREELIDLWTGEGLFDETQSKQEQQNKGHTILNKLENACLLESVTDWGAKCVKMHDLIRDMGIFITQSHPCFMVRSGLLLKEVPEEELWTEDLERVSLRENKIEELPCDMSPMCPKLTVLMLCLNPLKAIRESFFVHLSSLRVLNLSRTLAERLPERVSDLENLRALILGGCGRLTYVPSLAKVTKLRVLDLPNNGRVLEAPGGMERLKCLERLTYCCWSISDLTYFNSLTESCCRLCCYNFWLYDRLVDPVFAKRTYENNKVLISGVEFGQDGPSVQLPGTMQVLEIYGCDVNGRTTLGDVFPSMGGATELKGLRIDQCRGLRYISSAPQQQSSIYAQLDTLELLHLWDLPELQGDIQLDGIDTETETGFPSPCTISGGGGGMFSHLRQLSIMKCPKLKVVFQVKLLWQHLPFLPNLERIEVAECAELEEIFESSSNSRNTNLVLALPNLRELELVGLPNVSCIYRGLLLCTCLELLVIRECPMLEESLPLSKKTMICGASPPTLSSILTCADNLQWQEAFRLDYPKGALVLPSFTNQGGSSQAVNDMELTILNLKNEVHIVVGNQGLEVEEDDPNEVKLECSDHHEEVQINDDEQQLGYDPIKCRVLDSPSKLKKKAAATQMKDKCLNCLLYCGIFPKDYEVDEDTLIQLWMAAGFIISGTMEYNTSAEYLQVLTSEGCLSVSREDPFSGKLWYKINRFTLSDELSSRINHVRVDAGIS